MLTNALRRWVSAASPSKNNMYSGYVPHCFLSRLLDAAIITMLTLLGVLICVHF